MTAVRQIPPNPSGSAALTVKLPAAYSSTATVVAP